MANKTRRKYESKVQRNKRTSKFHPEYAIRFPFDGESIKPSNCKPS